MPERWAKQRGAAAVICAARSWRTPTTSDSEFLYFSEPSRRARASAAAPQHEISVYASASPRGHSSRTIALICGENERIAHSSESGRPAVVRSSAPASSDCSWRSSWSRRISRHSARHALPSPFFGAGAASASASVGSHHAPAASSARSACFRANSSSEHCIPFTAARVSE